MNINDYLNEFEKIALNPKAKLDECLAAGKKAVGVMPYFAPEELVYAAGMMPFGLWGAEMQVSESKKYFPAFYCSIVHTVLELGIKGSFNGLSAVMIPLTCDALKGMGTNWSYGTSGIPVIDVPYAQNRKTDAGIEFTTAKYKAILSELENISGSKTSNADIAEAIEIFNENRLECLRFTKLAADHPDLVNCRNRALVLKARYFEDRAKHTRLLRSLNELLEKAAPCEKKYKRIVTSGIIEDTEKLMEIFDENRFCIVSDQVAHESVDLRYSIPFVKDDPVKGYGLRLSQIEGTSVIFDPVKERCHQLINLAKDNKADGIVWVGCKFCDPDEFDYPRAKAEADKAGIPFLSVEIDQQMVNYEQIRTAAETFGDII